MENKDEYQNAEVEGSDSIAVQPAPNENTIEETDAKVTEPDQGAADQQSSTLPIVENKKPKNAHRGILVGVAIVSAFLIAGGGVFAWSQMQKDKSAENTTAQAPKIQLLGAEFSVVDGTVQQSTDNISWKDVKIGDQVEQGSFVRTQNPARAVITLDDGSAIRLNSLSVVKIDSLDSENVVATNVSGEIYTRIVKSDRQFSVKIDDETFQALGTAFITKNAPQGKGVEVYESSVKLAKSNIQVPEGQYYYLEAERPEYAKKLLAITPEYMKLNTFLTWNYEQDKKSADFKEKLGYLTKIDEPVAQEAVKPATQATTATGLSLSGYAYDTGVKLTWKVNGLTAPKGFKIVKSLTKNPEYGKNDAVYSSSASSRSYAWSIKDGKTYHFRVCIYTGSSCTNYSNDITVKAPLYSAPEPSGTLTLKNTGGKNFSWILNGSAPNGFKLVWSTSPSPVYPGSDYAFYSDASTRSGAIDETTGEYYVRVCMYKSGSCVNYSNEILANLDTQ